MLQITGEENDAEMLMNKWICAMKSWELRSTEEIKATYLQHLYRREGWHTYVEREVSTAPTAIAQQGVEGAFLAQFIGITEQVRIVAFYAESFKQALLTIAEAALMQVAYL